MIRLTVPEDSRGGRLDRALAELAPEGLSRTRIAALIRDGAVAEDGATVTDPAGKVKPGRTYELTLPAPEAPVPQPEAIPLDVIFEDAHLIVVDKPAGMVVHPAPGSRNGTLVNALLHHCGATLSGIGGVRRPGIVHRIDKDTSGLLVVAKTDIAHHGLSALFAAHDLTREYLALVRGVPDRADPRLMGTPGVSVDGPWLRIETLIGRHRTDRKKMAVTKGGPARRAVTRFRIERKLNGAALLRCRLETGRTHQIRVHMAHLGHGLIGDQTYGRSARAGLPPLAAAFPRQALHAATLEFRHPVTHNMLKFFTEPPTDFRALVVYMDET
ncbi:RluA family pseudouridine synthase [Pikeienuella sp. HZG-20]|uniref:RluA family pseudouridine synthase n=1 Tax=Paludibacillus litoralis TaxID=3133267 RepID=UPI0030EE14A3